MSRFLKRHRFFVYGCVFGAVMLVAGVQAWGWRWWVLMVGESALVACEGTFGPRWEARR